MTHLDLMIQRLAGLTENEVEGVRRMVKRSVAAYSRLEYLVSEVTHPDEYLRFTFGRQGDFTIAIARVHRNGTDLKATLGIGVSKFNVHDKVFRPEFGRIRALQRLLTVPVETL